MEDAGWDPLEETERLYEDVGSLMQAPLHAYAPIRLGLLLYSHLTARSTGFFHEFMTTYAAHRLSYKESKVVRGRIGPGDAYEDITLLVHPTGGVYGFTSGGETS